MPERWPPIYDADDLKSAIAELARPDLINQRFYGTEPRDEPWCQGDILQLQTDLPYIAADGQPAVMANLQTSLWMLVGNTCDLNRSIDEMDTTALVPIIQQDANQFSTEQRQSLNRYNYSRQFYLPPWSQENTDIMLADLTKPVTTHRNGLTTAGSRLARLSYTGWLLLHACLVRFFARDDGRFD